MDQWTCMVVDDEVPASRLLEGYVSKTECLRFVNTYFNAIDALESLSTRTIDLVFLDIQMPEMTGLELAARLPKHTSIIFTTAHSQFALDGFRFDAIDFLLKPVDFTKFSQAIDKFKRRRKNANLIESDYTFFREGHEYHKVYFDEILFFESQRNYLKVTTTKRTLVIQHAISEMERKLPDKFLRVHRSFIISKEHIDTIKSAQVLVGAHSIPIGASYRHVIDAMVNGLPT